MTDPARLVAEARRELARLPDVLEGMLGNLDGATARIRPAAREWTPVEIICHLRDEEAEDFRARIELLLAGGRKFARIDPERWADERRYGEAELAEVMAELKRRRAASLQFIDAVDPEALRGAAPLGPLGELSGLDLMAAWLAHDRLHLAQLAGTLARLGARRWSPLKSDYAGPIPYAEP